MKGAFVVLFGLLLCSVESKIFNRRVVTNALLSAVKAPSKPSDGNTIQFIDGSLDDDDYSDDIERGTADSKPTESSTGLPTENKEESHNTANVESIAKNTTSVGSTDAVEKPADFEDRVQQLVNLRWPEDIARKALVSCNYNVDQAAELLEDEEEKVETIRENSKELVGLGWTEEASVHALMESGGNVTVALQSLTNAEQKIQTTFNNQITAMVKGGWNERIVREASLAQWQYDRRKQQGLPDEFSLTSEQLAKISPTLRRPVKANVTSTEGAETSDASTSKQPTTPPTPAKREDCIFDVTANNFQSLVLDSKVPVLVDIYADWCGPCKQLTPMLEKAAMQSGGMFRLAKINADVERSIVDTLEATALPTLFICHKGKLIDRFVGAPQGSQLQNVLVRAVTGVGKRETVNDISDKELSDYTRSISSLAGLSSISFSQKSAYHKQIEELIKDSGNVMTSGMKLALKYINAAKNDIRDVNVKVINSTVTDLSSDKSAVKLLSVAGFDPVYDEQQQITHFELSHFNPAVLDIVTQHVSSTLQKVKFASINKSEPVLTRHNSVKSVTASKEPSAASKPVETPFDSVAKPVPKKPSVVSSPVIKHKPVKAPPSTVTVTYRALDSSVERLSISALESTTLGDAILKLVKSEKLKDNFRVQVRHPVSLTLTATSEELQMSIASIAGTSSSIMIQELASSLIDKPKSTSFLSKFKNSMKSKSSTASSSSNSASKPSLKTNTLFSSGISKANAKKNNEYFGGDSTVVSAGEETADDTDKKAKELKLKNKETKAKDTDVDDTSEDDDEEDEEDEGNEDEASDDDESSEEAVVDEAEGDEDDNEGDDESEEDLEEDTEENEDEDGEDSNDDGEEENE